MSKQHSLFAAYATGVAFRVELTKRMITTLWQIKHNAPKEPVNADDLTVDEGEIFPEPFDNSCHALARRGLIEFNTNKRDPITRAKGTWQLTAPGELMLQLVTLIDLTPH
jgi:hypothetical protein